MNVLTTLACATALAAGIPITARSQSLPGKNLSATIRVRGATTTGDTTTVSYSLANGGASAERLQSFTVSLPAVLKSMSAPGPDSIWVVMGAYRNREAIHWAYIPGVVQGDSTPTLQLSAIGLPTIVTAWYQGDSVIVDDDGSMAAHDYDVLDDLSNKVQTVGITTAPGTLALLLTRLRALTDSSCALSWITSSGTCTLLDAHLSASPRRFFGYITSLDSARTAGSTLTDAGYFMLKANTDYIKTFGDTATAVFARACVGHTAKLDGYNYGYGPLNFTYRVNGGASNPIVIPGMATDTAGPTLSVTGLFGLPAGTNTFDVYYNGSLFRSLSCP